MADYIERGLREIDLQFRNNPKTREATDAIRAVVWPAVASGDFPRFLTMPDQDAFVYIHPDFEFHSEDGVLVFGKDRAYLTRTESAILRELSRRPNRVISKVELAKQLRSSIDGNLGTDEKAVNVHISHLRLKLDHGQGRGTEFSPIQTVRGIGLKLVDPSRVTPRDSDAE